MLQQSPEFSSRGVMNGVYRPIRVLLFGAGAVGAMVGWRLAQVPQVHVSVICRSNYEVVKSKGFSMSSPKWGTGCFIPDSVYQHARDIRQRPFDYVICSNKVTNGTIGDYEELKNVVDRRTTLVSFQNGIDVEAPLRRTFPNNTLISGIVYYSCRQLSMGIVHHEASIRPYLSGLALDSERQRSLDWVHNTRFRDFIDLGHGEFTPLGNFLNERWIKQLWNGAFNPLCAIYQRDTQQLLNHTSSGRSLVKRVMRETYNIATATGVSIKPNIPENLIDITCRSPPIEPSMLQDLCSGRAMEIETLSGNICRLGVSMGVDVNALKDAYTELVRLNSALTRTRLVKTFDKFAPTEVGTHMRL